jgi:MOSC domain-containing protein YiiM
VRSCTVQGKGDVVGRRVLMYRGAMAHVHQINVSKGGVPKRPVDRAMVTGGGMSGDDQANKRHHGGPRQTLCLYSLEVIEALRDEGHPIEPGFAGENITMAGIEWPGLAERDRFRIGPELVIEITDPTAPCSKNAGWFLDGDFRRMSHEAHPGFSRWYAIVVAPGEVGVGDKIEKLPA